jgi:hypothetical protein
MTVQELVQDGISLGGGGFEPRACAQGTWHTFVHLTVGHKLEQSDFIQTKQLSAVVVSIHLQLAQDCPCGDGVVVVEILTTSTTTTPSSQGQS